MRSGWLKAVLVVGLIWCLLAGGAIFLWNNGMTLLPQLIDFGTQRARAEKQETNQFAAAGLEGVSVQSGNGSITVTGSDSDAITLVAKYVARDRSQASAEQRLEQLKTDSQTSNGWLVIKPDFGTASDRAEISYELSVPSSLRLRAETGNGAISVDEMIGQVELTTHNGAITALGSDGPKELRATTGNGAIRISCAPAEGTYTLQTGNGRVEVELPSSLGIELTAMVGNGEIDIGDGQWTTTGGGISGKKVRATRGDGALRLTITSGNGKVSIDNR